MFNFVKNDVLQRLENRHLLSVINRSNDCDLVALFDVINFVKCRLGKSNIKMVEVGCSLGESSAVFAQIVNELYCVDAWDIEILKDEYEKKRWNELMPEIERIFDIVCKEYSNVHKIKGNSINVVNNFNDEFFDFVYIDAEHSYENVRNDLLVWKNKTIKYIGGHDYHPQFPGVIKAVTEIFHGPLVVFKDSSFICSK